MLLHQRLAPRPTCPSPSARAPDLHVPRPRSSLVRPFPPHCATQPPRARTLTSGPGAALSHLDARRQPAPLSPTLALLIALVVIVDRSSLSPSARPSLTHPLLRPADPARAGADPGPNFPVSLIPLLSAEPLAHDHPLSCLSSTAVGPRRPSRRPPRAASLASSTPGAPCPRPRPHWSGSLLQNVELARNSWRATISASGRVHLVCAREREGGGGLGGGLARDARARAGLHGEGRCTTSANRT